MPKKKSFFRRNKETTLIENNPNLMYNRQKITEPNLKKLKYSRPRRPFLKNPVN